MNTFVIASGVDRQSNAIKHPSSDAKAAEIDATQQELNHYMRVLTIDISPWQQRITGKGASQGGLLCLFSIVIWLKRFLLFIYWPIWTSTIPYVSDLA